MTRPTGKLDEHAFNREFARVLAETDPRWLARADEYVLAERTGTLDRGRADVLIDDPGMPAAAVETSFDSVDADRDARNRLGRRTARGGRELLASLAVHIPGECRDVPADAVRASLRDGTQQVGYALHQKGWSGGSRRRWPASGFIRGTVHDASRLIAEAAIPKEVADARADRVALLVKQAAATLRSKLHGRTQREIAGVVGQHSPLEGLRTTMVLWLNALLIQQRLHVQGVRGIPPVRTALGVRPDPFEQVEVWRRMAEIRRQSVYQPGVRALAACGDLHRAGTIETLTHLIEAVDVIEDADSGRHISVGADLFPKLASDRKESAAFYTQPATAELLAALTIRRTDKPDSEWARSDLLRRAIIADLACGTGALLRAGYSRVRTLHGWAGGMEDSVAELHRGAMEFGLRGTDISPIAAHLTFASLASFGKHEQFGHAQIGCLKVGGASGRTGALEYMDGSAAEDLLGPDHGGSAGTENGKSSLEVLHGSADWILMNPPYSRTRGGQSAFDLKGLTKQERKRCQKRWGRLVKKEPAQLRAGMAASFLVLAKHKAKPGTGRIGFVLPLTCAFADTWTETRRMVESEFSDIVMVATASGASLQRVGFSADTGMEEMLLVATRRKNPREESRSPCVMLHCVTLYEPCVRNGEAGEVARAIRKAAARCVEANTTHPVTVGNGRIGCVTTMRASGLGSPWNMVGVTHGGLALAADALTRGVLDHVVGTPIPLGLEMGTIEEVFDVGPTHHMLGHPKGASPIGAFEFHPVASKTDATGADRALWKADWKEQRSLRVLPTHKGLSPPEVGATERREAMRATAGRLFYARNLRWTSQALLAGTTAHSALGGRAWTALRHGEAPVRKAFALWWNSTLGMVVHWTQGQRTQNGRSTTQVGALRKIPCPRLDKLSDAALNVAVQRFDRLAQAKLLPAKDAAKDPVRRQIDAAVSEMIEVHNSPAASEQAMRFRRAAESRIGNAMEALRELWCAEPSVHGWKGCQDHGR